MITKIISGGQTGADQAGLMVAHRLGLERGGTAPPGFLTEDGPKPTFLQAMGLVEGKPDPKTYPKRTRKNIQDSDGTVIFGDIKEPGSKLTANICRTLEKPWVNNPGIIFFLRWAIENNIQVLNVAGNRESKSPGIYDKVFNFLYEALKEGNK